MMLHDLPHVTTLLICLFLFVCTAMYRLAVHTLERVRSTRPTRVQVLHNHSPSCHLSKGLLAAWLAPVNSTIARAGQSLVVDCKGKPTTRE